MDKYIFYRVTICKANKNLGTSTLMCFLFFVFFFSISSNESYTEANMLDIYTKIFFFLTHLVIEGTLLPIQHPSLT